MTSPTRPADFLPCPTCRAELAPELKGCPSCGTLVHAEELTQLAGAAEEAERQGELAAALSHWKEALDLLPAAAPQRPIIDARVRSLHDRIIAGEKSTAADAKPKTPGVRETWRSKGWLAALGALLLKFKALIFVLLGKAKLILLGLAKLKTLLSVLAYFGVYWAMYGWPFAAGLVVSIYIHEMGHVFAARRYGIKASAPVFIPFLGAFILLKERVTDVRVNARIGLEGPVFGLGAALLFYVAYLATQLPILAVIAATGAFINMFNLLPVFFLDGARGYSSLSWSDRWAVVAGVALIAYLLSDPFAAALSVVGAGVTLFGGAAEESDKPMMALYLFLVGSLAVILHSANLHLARR